MTCATFRKPAQRDAAWGRYLARRGLDCITRTYFHPLSREARLAMYQLRAVRQMDASRFSGAAR